MPFKQQEFLLKKCVAEINRAAYLLGVFLDATGNGEFLAEAAGEVCNATAVRLSEAWYRENMPRLKAAFEDRTIAIPKSLGVYEDLRSVEMVNGVARVPDKRSKVEGQQRHGDSAIALALAYAASRGDGVAWSTMPDNAPASAHGYAPPVDEYSGDVVGMGEFVNA